MNSQHLRVPAKPGVYVVELLNDEPISVNADRPAIADRCIKVTKHNCKYGRAVNLARRESDYFKTFGAHNVRFRFVTLTEDFAAIEAIVSATLSAFRICGNTGRRNEWLHGISAVEVEAVVLAAIAAHGKQEPVARPSMGGVRGPRAGGSPPAVEPLQVAAAARYLEQQEMPLELLRDLHHSPGRKETFRATQRYFTSVKNLKPHNIRYGRRLMHVANERKLNSRPFDVLVTEAVARFADA